MKSELAECEKALREERQGHQELQKELLKERAAWKSDKCDFESELEALRAKVSAARGVHALFNVKELPHSASLYCWYRKSRTCFSASLDQWKRRADC